MVNRMEFNLDLSQLNQALARSPEAVSRALETGLTDIKNDWRAEAVDVAPIDTGNLRRQIYTEIFSGGNEVGVEAGANSTRGPSVLTSQKTGRKKYNDKRFNYAYYIHESNGKAVTGEKKFLEKPARDNQEKWRQWLERELSAEFRRAGW
ncbi:HK97 gp10 family phage protein [Lysinibacillus boronitolerans]|uniref:HK97 gp10 family phage protein n=1 Tax=Lysinibacillus boronitolerans TaxID=309788 RepID=UPI000FFC1365|nr:HK97 gp10 family phage protein [Lysinibacillus boronitolerans]